jgi:heterodisulfide reductase subunit C
VECPRLIQITDVMYALKREAIERGIYPRRFPIPVLANEFSKMVMARGRVNEAQLAMRLFLRTNWMELLRGWKMGLLLFFRGRLGIFDHEKIRNQRDLADMLNERGPGRRAS